jgi:D-alanyl-D-alanine carboxypeptidase (penicillin-binding protein 5/6)
MTLAIKTFIAVVLLPIMLGAGAGHYASAFAASRVNRSSGLLDSRHKFHPESYNAGRRVVDAQPLAATLFPPSSIKQRPGSREYRKDAVSEEDLRRRISSRSVILIDGLTGQVIFEQLPDLPAQPASTIKVLTGLIALQTLKDKDLVPVSSRASNMPRSKVYLERNKSYHAGDLINAVLVSSANDASVALAEKIAGSEKVFSKLMTHKARAWGATNTVCKTASGLTATGQQSTARDLAVLFSRAMENGEFATRMARSKVKTGFGRVLRNHNKALWEIDGTEGGKTGYTKAARQTYVGKFRRGDDEMVLAILGSETMWDDIKNLVSYGFEAMAGGETDRSAQLSPVGARPPLAQASGGDVPQILNESKKASVM